MTLLRSHRRTLAGVTIAFVALALLSNTMVWPLTRSDPEPAELQISVSPLDGVPDVASDPRVAAVPTPAAGLRTPPGWPLPAASTSAPRVVGDAPPEISAAAAVVLDEASLAVLYEKAPNERRAPASLTKIATAILVAEHGDLDSLVVSDVDSREMPRSTVMGLLPGDAFTLRDLLYGLMLPSGNDAALAIARHLAGSEGLFAEQMTALARRLGLTDTRFANPHGLSARGHYSSAYDIAVLARYLMSVPELREVVAAPSWTAEGPRTIELRTLNALLWSYPGADGVKTGYTQRAGRTYAGSAVRDGHRIIVVLLDAPERDWDARTLLDWAFDGHEWPEAVASATALIPHVANAG